MRQRDEAGARHRPPSEVSRTPATRRVAVGVLLVLLGVVLVVTVVAVQQLGSRRTDLAGSVAVADFPASATVEDEPAPAFELPTLDGRGTIGLDDFRRKFVVLNFWASWCGPCRTEAPHLQATWETYRGRGVQFLGVDYRDDPAAAEAFVDELGLTYPSVIDSGELAPDYGVVGLPTTLIITPERRIAYRFVGKVDAVALRRALDDAMSATR